MPKQPKIDLNNDDFGDLRNLYEEMDDNKRCPNAYRKECRPCVITLLPIYTASIRP